MIVGGYTMDLYCENIGTPLAGSLFDVCGHRYDGGKASFFAEDSLKCRQQAYAQGWILRVSKGLAYCPACTKGMKR